MKEAKTLLELEYGCDMGNMKQGKYNIYIIGGLGIKVNSGFKLLLKNYEIQKEILIIENRNKVRTLIGLEKAIKFGNFSITDSGKYYLYAVGREFLEIKESRLFIRNLISNTTLDNDEIEICVRKQNWFS
jgi:hypothetical protein